MMACGCVAQGKLTHRNGEALKPPIPWCGVHQCGEIVEPPDLTGRTSRCSYGAHDERPSSIKLPFFVHQPDKDHDRHYCGCYGWD
jgi:hypothetical protein